MFCCIYLVREKCTKASTEIFEINLLRTWCVDIESRISPKYTAYTPFFCWKVKVSVQCMAGFGNFRPDIFTRPNEFLPDMSRGQMEFMKTDFLILL